MRLPIKRPLGGNRNQPRWCRPFGMVDSVNYLTIPSLLQVVIVTLAIVNSSANPESRVKLKKNQADRQN
ncbi:unnamed protein product [Protopolystoma xenopodis]|uniref:Uncharacterized protein n=1 Tax=Protopolystoma xenopodis TaxID=117903 RepID=A0A3S5FD61_9PLAT|nr:unnamed protein product [Protopolystoma xenopodis]